MFKTILIGLLVVVAGFAAFVASRPAQFHIERATAMSAGAQDAYDSIADFHQWADWSPWDKLDPTMKRTYSGSPSGQGARYEWAGNDKVGEGAMTITAAQPGEKVLIKLEFKKPFAQTNLTTFSLKPEGDKVTVTWAMDGENAFVGKAFGVIMNVDKMVGDDFEKGLAAMKTAAEARAVKRKAEAAAEAAAAEAKRLEEAAKAAPAAGEPAPAAGGRDLVDPWKSHAPVKKHP